jgi:hypothetical protein
MSDEFPEHFEDGWRAFLCQMLVDSRAACAWASANLTSQGVGIRLMKSRWQLDRVKNAVYAWNWVFGDGDGSVLPFTSACEDLGLDEYAVRNRILAQCEANPGINELVPVMLRELERIRLTRKREPEDASVDLEAYGRIFRSKRASAGHDAEPQYG